jgi:hypothetical protein
MAIWNRKNVDKALPASATAGATVTNFSQEQLSALANQMQSAGVFEAMPRNPFMMGIPFSPSNPLHPAAINPIGERGRPDPRRWEYPVAWNVFVTEQRLVPWKVLRTAADQIDILRRCVEVLKAKALGMDWDITFSDSASELFAKDTGLNHVRAMQDARDKYSDQITTARRFWETPDRINGLGFKDWLGMALEDLIVLDALAIYPHPDLKGDLHSLEILDATTIKPLLDDRGMRPAAPYPAYQQILYGFPRGEFLASDENSADGEYSADELIYLKRNHRTFTPYGFSAVERALPVADIYMKRQQWLRAEFTDGTTPSMWLKPSETINLTPDQLRAYEQIMNDDLAGQADQRHRMRILFPGLDPIDNSGSSEKFNDTQDNYLVTSITGHFGVLPTEIGFSAKGGLGGSGHQAGEAEAASRLGAEPIMKWLEAQLSDIMYRYLGTPRELVFRFLSGHESDTLEGAQRREIETNTGQRAINESRAEIGLPLIDSPYADMPMIKSGSNSFFITPDGIVAVGTPSDIPAGATPEPVDATPENTTPETVANPDLTGEVKAFLKWAKKSQEREFEFLLVDEFTGSALNRAAKMGDAELVKALADGVLKKA